MFLNLIFFHLAKFLEKYFEKIDCMHEKSFVN